MTEETRPRRTVRRAFQRPIVAGVAASALAAALAAWMIVTPSLGEGPLPLAALTPTQQALVGAAVAEWDAAEAPDPAVTVATESAATAVEWQPTGDDDSGVVRISGPGLWIEYVHQPGVGIAGMRIREEARDPATPSAA